MDYGYWTTASGLVDCHQEEPSAFVVDHSGIGRELIVAGVVTDTRTVTSKFVLGVYTLTNYIICRDSEAVLKSLKFLKSESETVY